MEVPQNMSNVVKSTSSNNQPSCSIFNSLYLGEFAGQQAVKTTVTVVKMRSAFTNRLHASGGKILPNLSNEEKRLSCRFHLGELLR